ncbi:MAG TPA: glycosyltransferase [Terriglobia bacterium]|nr:glycosyltransferase [Terriglobia bacterium]
MNTKQTSIIYRDELLAASETFIPAQAGSLEHFRPLYVGLRRVQGLPLAESECHIISCGGVAGVVQRARFKLLGPDARLRRKLQQSSPALMHAHFAPDACNALALAESLRIPLLVSLHGYDITVGDQHHPAAYRWRRERLRAQASRFLCVSNFLRGKAIARGFPAAKTVVHYTGTDVDFFRPDPRVPRSPVVLFVGRLVPVKGCEYLIRAMTCVQRSAPEARLVVIGDGYLRPKLEQQAASSLRNFEFLGAQQPAAVRLWMNRASVLCTPSVSMESGYTEAFGMVFVEAQAMGLPVVSFASGGIPEAVAEGETGFLVKERDWQALANRLLRVLTDRDLWARFSQAGQSRVRTLFDIRKQAMALDSIYQQVLEEWNSTRGILKNQNSPIPQWSEAHV